MSDQRRRRQEEARRYAEFASRDAEERFRAPLAYLYEHTHLFMAEFLGDKQSLPHIGFGPTASRSLSDLGMYTGNGGDWEITLNEGLAVDINPAWVRHPFPSPGCRRFLAGFVERQLVRQHVWEVEGDEERGYGGYGPRFGAHANRISIARGRFAQVIPRRRGQDDPDSLLGKGWPHGPELVADPDCYTTDLTQSAIDLAVCPAASRQVSRGSPPTLHVWEWILHMIAVNRIDALRSIAAAQVDLLHLSSPGYPVLSAFEKGRENADGSPIADMPLFDPAWQTWEGGIIPRMARGLYDCRSFHELPILADALEEAGCLDERITDHLKAEGQGHDKRCWVLRGLLGITDAAPGA